MDKHRMNLYQGKSFLKQLKTRGKSRTLVVDNV